ncbi:hypothetical protein [Microseira wollei]|nr:hypothetical protein [Microseira wollei]
MSIAGSQDKNHSQIDVESNSGNLVASQGRCRETSKVWFRYSSSPDDPS